MSFDLLVNFLISPGCYCALFGLILFICTLYFFMVVQEPTTITAKGAFYDFLLENMPILSEKYWPTLWCLESRAQTIFANLLRRIVLRDINYRREILTLKDGGEVALDWAEENTNSNSPIVVILPGLTGDSQSEYVKCLVYAAKSFRAKCVVFNFRGMAGIKLKTPRFYCAANCEDLTEVIDHIKKLHPEVAVGATGISMGGLLVAQYLIQEKEKAKGKLKAACLLSAPFNAFESLNSIEKGFFNLMLNKYLCYSLQTILKKNFAEQLNLRDVDLPSAYKSANLREFDQFFTSKHFGYKDVEEYYTDATIHNKLHHIKIPLLCLNAADDPFQPIQVLPINEFSNSKNVALVLTSRGGHIGFLEGFWPLKEEQYIGKIFSQFFSAVFRAKEDHPAFNKHLN